jgi:hypothetical protein
MDTMAARRCSFVLRFALVRGCVVVDGGTEQRSKMALVVRFACRFSPWSHSLSHQPAGSQLLSYTLTTVLTGRLVMKGKAKWLNLFRLGLITLPLSTTDVILFERSNARRRSWSRLALPHQDPHDLFHTLALLANKLGSLWRIDVIATHSLSDSLL